MIARLALSSCLLITMLLGNQGSQERTILRAPGHLAPLSPPSPSTGSWPSFRSPNASGVADGQNLPDRWDISRIRTSDGGFAFRVLPTHTG